MPKAFKQYIQEAIGNKYVNHQLLSKKGYELMGTDQYYKKGAPGIKLKKGAEWVSLKDPKLKGKSTTDLARYLRSTGGFQIDEDVIKSEAHAKKLYKKYKKELEKYDDMEKRKIRMLPGEQIRSRELRFKMKKLKKMIGPDYPMEEVNDLEEKCHGKVDNLSSDKNPNVKEGMNWKPYTFRRKREKEMNVNREKERMTGMKKIPIDMKFKQKNS
jgi:hypothetical protein